MGSWGRKEEGEKRNALVLKTLFWPTFWTYHFFFRAQYTELPKSDMERRTLVRPILLPDHNDIDASRKGCLINAFVQLLHSNQDLSCKLPYVVHSLRLRERKKDKKKKKVNLKHKGFLKWIFKKHLNRCAMPFINYSDYCNKLYTNIFKNQQNFEVILISVKVSRVIKSILNALSTWIYD